MRRTMCMSKQTGSAVLALPGFYPENYLLFRRSLRLLRRSSARAWRSARSSPSLVRCSGVRTFNAFEVAARTFDFIERSARAC